MAAKPKQPNLARVKTGTPSLDSWILHATELLETFRGQRGNELDRALTVRDLTPEGVNGISTINILRSIAANEGYIPPPTVIPTVLSNLATVAGLGVVFLSWDGTNQVGYSHTEIWRSTTDALGTAVKIATSVTPLFADYTGDGTERFYWVRAISTSGHPGPFNATAGTSGQAADDPTYVLSVLQNRITETQLFTTLSARIDLIDAAGTGLVDRMSVTETATDNNASAITTLFTSVGDNSSAISTEASVRATADGVLGAEYTIKADVNGHVAGMGVAVDGGASGPITSEIIMMSDKFAIVLPSSEWLATHTYTLGQFVKPSTATGFIYKCIVAGDTAASEPTWPVILGNTVVDGGVTWEAADVNQTVPFVVGNVGGVPTVGIDGTLVVDGTIVAAAIAAGQVGATHISVADLDAISASMGTLTSGTIRTAASPSWRTELTSVGSFPFWFGMNTTSETNGRFYLKSDGSMTIRDHTGAVVMQTFAGAAPAFNSAIDNAQQAWSDVAGAGRPANEAMSGTNLVPDGDFSLTATGSDYTYWAFNATGVNYNATVGFGGKPGAQLVGGGRFLTGKKDINFVEGQSVFVSTVAAKGLALAGVLYTNIVCYDSSDVEVSTIRALSHNAINMTTVGDWYTETTLVTLPATTAYIRAELETWSGTATTFNVDRVIITDTMLGPITPANSGVYIENASIITAHIDDLAVETIKIKDQAVTFSTTTEPSDVSLTSTAAFYSSAHSHTSSGAPLIFMVSLKALLNTLGHSDDLSVSIERNLNSAGWAHWRYVAELHGYNENIHDYYTLQKNDSGLSSGDLVQYRVKAQYTDIGSSATVSYINMFTLETKK